MMRFQPQRETCALALLFVFAGSAAAGQISDGPDATLKGGQSLAEFGAAVQTAGDINGDGWSDLIVGAPYHDNGQVNEGRVYVYLGQAGGGPTLYVTLEVNQDNARFGSAVATAGDVNGDGFSDVIIGAPGYRSNVLDELAEGAVFLYLGGPSLPDFATADWMLVGEQKAARFGAAVATAGDVNGDGYSDVVVGEPGYSIGQADEGRAHVILGGGKRSLHGCGLVGRGKGGVRRLWNVGIVRRRRERGWLR